jgi:hypothetical protein
MTARLGRAEVLRRLAAGGTPEQARLLEAALAVLRVLKREWPDAKAHAPNPVRRAEFEFLMHNGLACVMGDQTMSCHAGGKGDRRWTEVAAELQEAARIAAEESVDPRLVVVCQVNKVLVSLYDPEAIAEVDPGFDARLTLRRVFITNPAYLEQCVRAFAVDPDFDSVRTELAELLGPYNRLN